MLTDSRGVQEEACILGVPYDTLIDNTKRPETLDVGTNILASTNPCEIVDKAISILNRHGAWENPFGDGYTGDQIVQLLIQKFVSGPV